MSSVPSVAPSLITTTFWVIAKTPSNTLDKVSALLYVGMSTQHLSRCMVCCMCGAGVGNGWLFAAKIRIQTLKKLPFRIGKAFRLGGKAFYKFLCTFIFYRGIIVKDKLLVLVLVLMIAGNFWHVFLNA